MSFNGSKVLSLSLGLLFFLGGCRLAEEPIRADQQLESLDSLPEGSDTIPPDAAPIGDGVQLVDSAILEQTRFDDWGYQRRGEADLDGDGTPEEVVVAARAERVGNRIAWDDGQPWIVYVEAADGTRTMLYARYLQLGTLHVRLTLPDSGRGSRILVQEEVPDQLAIYEFDYLGPGESRGGAVLRRALDPTGEFSSPDFP